MQSRQVDLRSDTFSLPTDAMYEALRQAPLGDDVYGEDATVRALETRAAAVTGKEAALLVTSGTQGNLVALMSVCDRGDEALLGRYSDLCNFESGGIAAVAGIYPRALDDQPGCIDAAEVERAVRPNDVHFGRTRVLCIENSHARSGGLPVPIDVLEALREVTRRRGLWLHMDGARLFNAAIAQGVDPATIASHADSVTFCLSKGLSCPVGSLLCGDPAFIGKARRMRKLVGGGLRQAGWLAAPGLIALEELSRLAEDHARARRLAQGLSDIDAIDVDVSRVRTNMVVVGVKPPIESAAALIEAVRKEGVRCFSLGDKLRLVTYRGIGDEDIEYAITAFRKAAAAAGHSARSRALGPY